MAAEDAFRCGMALASDEKAPMAYSTKVAIGGALLVGGALEDAPGCPPPMRRDSFGQPY